MRRYVEVLASIPEVVGVFDGLGLAGSRMTHKKGVEVRIEWFPGEEWVPRRGVVGRLQ